VQLSAGEGKEPKLVRQGLLAKGGESKTARRNASLWPAKPQKTGKMTASTKGERFRLEAADQQA